MSRFYYSFFVVNLLAFVILFVWGDYKMLLNVELAAMGTLITTLGTYRGYKKHVEKRSKDIAPEDADRDDPDVIDKIEDPYGLYDDDDEIDTRDPEEIDVKEYVKETKKTLKKNRDWGEILRSSKGAVSIFRVVGYCVILYSFFYLVDKNIFHPFGFLIGIGLVPFTALVSAKKMV